MKIVDVFDNKTKQIKFKLCHSLDYNFIFQYSNGLFMRWGKTKEDNPEYSKYGCEIVDIEISTICNRGCKFCYKGNTIQGKYMPLDTFKLLFSKLPKTVTQIAFGIGSIEGNPDMYRIFKHCRDNNVVPNVTINGDNLTDYHLDKLTELCGAVAISFYDNYICFGAVEKLTALGLKQVNIHALVSEETYQNCFNLIDEAVKNPKLKNLNAIVFLLLKPKGVRNTYTQIKSLNKYKKLIDYAFDKKVKMGFDSCSASAFTECVKNRNNFKELEQVCESCESTLFSFYINVDGLGFPCSFTEDIYKGINILKVNNFISEVWNNSEIKKFRNNLIKNKDCNNCRICQVFDLTMEGK